MSRDHYIPQLILRGFALDPTLAKDKREISILDTNTLQVETKLIGNSFMKVDCNSEGTETKFAQNYETPMGNILQQIKNAIRKNQTECLLKKSAYQKLFQFLVIMWRRNIIQVKKMEEYVAIFDKIFSSISPFNESEKTISQYYKENEDVCRKAFYEYVISITKQDEKIVKKTIENYRPIIIHNTTNVHFILHNTYSTLRYCCKPNEQIGFDDMPVHMIFPLSNDLCLDLILREQPLQLDKKQYSIEIETWDNPDDIKQFMIDGYITPTAESIVVDNTNLQFVLDKLRS